MNKKTLLILGVFAFSIFAMTSNASIVNAKESALPATVKIGFLYPATGALGAIGEGLLDGAKAAISRLNTDFSDVTFELVSADTGTDTNTGKTEAQNMVSDGIKIIVGPAASGVTLAAAEVTVPNKVPQISYSATSPAITDFGDDDYLFRVVASDLYQGQALAGLAINKSVTKAYVLNLDNAYGNGVAEQFKKKFKELGGTITGEIAYDPEASSFATEITTIKESTAEGIVIVAYPEDGNKIFAEAKTQAVDLKWFGTDGIADSSVTNNTGTKDYVLDKLYGTRPSTGTNPGEESNYTQYETDLATVSGKTGAFGDYSYDAVLLAGYALHTAGDLNGTLIRDSLLIIADGFSGATGADKAFNCDGEPLSQAYDFWKVNATDSTVQGEYARADEFSGLGSKTTVACGDHPYVPPTSPGFELAIFFVAAAIVATVHKKRRNKTV
jgi:ABC-type branched-subunit amino acid transport system substrate-binding protein